MTGEYHIQLYVKVSPLSPSPYFSHDNIQGALEQRPVYEPPGLPLQVVAAEPTLKETLLFSVAGHGLYGGAVGQTLSFEILVKSTFLEKSLFILICCRRGGHPPRCGPGSSSCHAGSRPQEG